MSALHCITAPALQVQTPAAECEHGHPTQATWRPRSAALESVLAVLLAVVVVLATVRVLLLALPWWSGAQAS